MKIIQGILELLRSKGFETRYGTAHQLNEFFTDVDFSQSFESTGAYMHLITSMETVDGRDRADVAVYFARLCDFDFDGEKLLPVQDEMKGYGMEILRSIRCGNELKVVGHARWQFGYDDFAENLCWVCMRVTIEDAVAECVPLFEGCQQKPDPPVPPTPPEIINPEMNDHGFTFMSVSATIVNKGGVKIDSASVFYRIRPQEGEEPERWSESDAVVEDDFVSSTIGNLEMEMIYEFYFCIYYDRKQACSKIGYGYTLPVISVGTLEVPDMTTEYVKLSGSVRPDKPYDACGFELTWEDGDGVHTEIIERPYYPGIPDFSIKYTVDDGMINGMEYTYRAFVFVEGFRVYGDTLTFKTMEKKQQYWVKTLDARQAGTDRCVLLGEIVGYNGTGVDEALFRYRRIGIDDKFTTAAASRIGNPFIKWVYSLAHHGATFEYYAGYSIGNVTYWGQRKTVKLLDD